MTGVHGTQAGGCEVCGAREELASIPVREDSRFTVLRCERCGFGRTHPDVPESEIGRWYPPAYYGEANVRFNPVMEALVRVFRRRRADVIARLTTPGKVLDVGCGRGFMLQTLRGLGYAVQGTELSAHAAKHASGVLGIDVHTGDFASAPYALGSFRAVIFWHSLEHFRDPLGAVARAAALLEPGGLLVIAVPNSDSLQARLFGGEWFHLDVPRHYVHFGTRSLRLALEAGGFRIHTVSHFSLEQNPYGALQSLYNAVGFPWNLLYSLLKVGSSRPAEARAHPFLAVAVFALLPLFVPLAFALWAIELVAQRGGTIDVYAQKVPQG